MSGRRMRELRKAKRLSQTELAQALEVSTSAVQKWEGGASEPGAKTLRRMAELFGVSIDDLCEYEPPENELTVMTRALRQMTPQEREQLLIVGKTLFAHAFKEDE